MSVVELIDVFRVHRTPEGDAAALQGLSLKLRAGELVCVLGPSGAGKSTLLRIVAGLEPPSAGVAQILGRDMGRLSARERAALRREAIGILDERSERSLPPDLPIGECVALPLRLRGTARDACEARTAELLEAVGLAERRHALPKELSGGERQRVALCAALSHRPLLLLADEPTGELDEASARTVRELLGSLVRTERAGAILVSHDPAAAGEADRVVQLRDGRVVEDSPAHENGRGGRSRSLIVGRGGWIRLPSELLEASGVATRVRIRRTPDGLLLTPGPAPSTGPAPSEGPAPSAGEQPPARAPKPATAPPSKPAQLEARALQRRFGRGPTERRVLEGVSHFFAPGRLTVVTGRSGSGKTTLLRLLCGLERPDGGEVLIDAQPLGRDQERLAELRRSRIGYLAQEPAPVPFLSARENVELALALRGCEQPAASQRAITELSRVGLSERARQRVARLSAGERQRVALARALACADGLLIVDEPTSRLDEAMTVAMAELLAGAASQGGQTVVCASHDELVTARADAVLEL